jgi:hypothetical protein
MNVFSLSEHDTPELARALEQFEAAFTYPLGVHQRFSIHHGADYLRFYRAMGEAQGFVAMDKGQIVGTLAVALRRLLGPDGQSQPAAYIGDLKIASVARGGRVLIHLARHAAAWAKQRTQLAFSVVMDGTEVTPQHYTGRAGLPAFGALAKLAVIRLPTESSVGVAQLAITTRFTKWETTLEQFQLLSAGRYAAPAFDPRLRSETAPHAIALRDGDACGFVEDTRLAKRLMVQGGAEMASAHLSHFAYRSVAASARVVQAACAHAAHLGLPALFFAVHQPDAELLLNALSAKNATIAGATVYGCGLPANTAWNINTSEI